MCLHCGVSLGEAVWLPALAFRRMYVWQHVFCIGALCHVPVMCTCACVDALMCVYVCACVLVLMCICSLLRSSLWVCSAMPIDDVRVLICVCILACCCVSVDALCGLVVCLLLMCVFS